MYTVCLNLKAFTLCVILPICVLHHFSPSGCCNGHRYRSTGSYDNGWFDGVCGTGHPFYLLCQACREGYLQENQAARVAQNDAKDMQGTSMASDAFGSQERMGASHLFTAGLVAPDLLGAAELRHDGRILQEIS